MIHYKCTVSGTVTAVHGTRGHVAEEGTEIITVSSPALLEAQRRLLAKLDDSASTLTDPRIAGEVAELRRHCFLPTQIEAIVKTRQPIDPVPVLAPGRCAIVFLTTVGAHFDVGERLFAAERWHHLVAPRGSALVALEREAGLRAQPGVGTEIATPVSERLSPSQATLESLAPYNPGTARPAWAVSDRISLKLNNPDWKQLLIATGLAEERDVYDSLEVPGTAVVLPAKERAEIRLRVCGVVDVANYPAGTILKIGDLIATIRQPALAEQDAFITSFKNGDGDEKPLLEAGFSVFDVNTIRRTGRRLESLEIVAHRPSIVVQMLKETRGEKGELVAVLQQPLAHVCEIGFDSSRLNAFSAQVSSDVFHVGSSSVFRNSATPLQVVPNPNSQLRVQIPFDPPPNVVKSGHLLNLRIEEPSSKRRSIVVENSCVMKVGEIYEVLVHTGLGELTPCPVEIGPLYEGRREIKSGLKAGDRLVRSLERLARNNNRVGAAIAGFFNPN